MLPAFADDTIDDGIDRVVRLANPVRLLAGTFSSDTHNGGLTNSGRAFTVQGKGIASEDSTNPFSSCLPGDSPCSFEPVGIEVGFVDSFFAGCWRFVMILRQRSISNAMWRPSSSSIVSAAMMRIIAGANCRWPHLRTCTRWAT
jgi:hypothetical protein